MHRRRHVAIERAVEVAPFARRDARRDAEAHGCQQAADAHRVGWEQLADEGDGRHIAARTARALHRAGLDLGSSGAQHRTRQHILGLGMGGNAEAGHVDADDAHTIDLFRQQVQRHAGRGRHAEVDDNDSVVIGRLRGLEHRIADVLVELATHERLGIEGHVADAAARTIEARGEGQAIDAAGGATEDRRDAAHPQADAQAAEGWAHRLRLVMRAARVVRDQLLQHVAFARGRGGGEHRLAPAMAAASGIGRNGRRLHAVHDQTPS